MLREVLLRSRSVTVNCCEENSSLSEKKTTKDFVLWYEQCDDKLIGYSDAGADSTVFDDLPIGQRCGNESRARMYIVTIVIQYLPRGGDSACVRRK